MKYNQTKKYMHMTIVDKIHAEFYGFGDSVVEKDSHRNGEKAARLAKVGFVSAAESVSFLKDVEVGDLVLKYRSKYPLHKFITHAAVIAICKTYNLVCGPVGVYTGFVPETKLKSIESFVVHPLDL